MKKYKFTISWAVGALKVERNASISSALSGTRKSIDFFCISRIRIRIIHIIRMLNYLKELHPKFAILIVGNNILYKELLPFYVKNNHGYLTVGWPTGLLSNWKIKIQYPLCNYLTKAQYACSRNETIYFRKVLMGLAPLVKKPNLVIFLNAKNIKAGLKECKKFRIPTIILIESRQSTLHTSYKLPCSKNLSVRWFILCWLLKTI